MTQRSANLAWIIPLLFACALPTLARAEVRVWGTMDKLVLEVKNATLPEIVSDIQATLNCKIRLTGSMSRQFTGAYAGSVRQVISRLLNGTDYFIVPTPDGISVSLVNAEGGYTGPQTIIHNPSGRTLTVTNAADERPASPVQGWTGKPSQPVSMAQQFGKQQTSLDHVAARIVPMEKLIDRPISDVQGWAGTPMEPASAIPVHPSNVAPDTISLKSQ